MIQFSLKQPEHSEADRPWYDTTLGITSALASLKGINQLVSERHDAGYNRGERLNQFYVLNGRYWLDTCGNCGSVNGIPKDIPHADIPLVLSQEDFFKFLGERTSADPMISSSMNGGNLPEPDLFCPQCEKGWTIDNCYDVVVYHNTEVFPLADFVGRTLDEVKLAYGLKSDAIYRMQPDILVRNDKYIDLSPKYPNPEADWEKGIVVNERGWIDKKWLDTRYGVADSYVIQEGDEGFFNVWKYFHKECNGNHLAAEEEKKFREIFEKAGFKVSKMTQLPNQYCPCEKCAPWYDVETEFGTVRIGWRKRVINIDWNKLSSTKTFPHLFEKEDVTKWEDGIHAWSWEKAEDYLSHIHKHLSAN